MDDKETPELKDSELTPDPDVIGGQQIPDILGGEQAGGKVWVKNSPQITWVV